MVKKRNVSLAGSNEHITGICSCKYGRNLLSGPAFKGADHYCLILVRVFTNQDQAIGCGLMASERNLLVQSFLSGQEEHWLLMSGC